MTNAPNTAGRYTVSQQERERRYAALRAGMQREGLAALVVCSRRDDSERGRIRYVSDYNMMGGRAFLILPLKGEAVLFQPSYVGSAWASSVGWVKDNRSAIDQAQAVAQTLTEMELGATDIGIVGLQHVIAVQDLRALEAALPQARLRDATLMFDMVRMLKSDEEIGYLRETSDILKRAFKTIEGLLRPGITECEIITEAKHTVHLLGCLHGFGHISRSGGLCMLHPPNDDVIQSSDVVTFDLEYTGPHGYALELSRHYSFGPPPEHVRRIFDVQVEAFEHCIEHMRPGVLSIEILEAARETYGKHGFYAAGPVGHGPVQFHAHGIGLDFGELPFVPGLDLTLQPGMVIALHPHIGPEDMTLPVISIEDNILITERGAERMSYAGNEWTML